MPDRSLTSLRRSLSKPEPKGEDALAARLEDRKVEKETEAQSNLHRVDEDLKRILDTFKLPEFENLKSKHGAIHRTEVLMRMEAVLNRLITERRSFEVRFNKDLRGRTKAEVEDLIDAADDACQKWQITLKKRGRFGVERTGQFHDAMARLQKIATREARKRTP